MTYFRFGFHAAGFGNNDAGQQYIQACAASNRPAVVFAVDNHMPAAWVQALERPFDIIGFRMTGRAGESLDLLDYRSDPVAFARHRFARTAHHWPTELDPRRVWTTPCNEPSKEPGDTDWLAAFTLEYARLSIEHGRRLAAYGWSMGTPEPWFWQLPDTLEFLSLCAQRPDLLAINLHEYSGTGNLRDDTPWLIGRFQELHNACDAAGIGRPNIIVAEFGWSEREIIPQPDGFADQLRWAQDLYGQHPNILGAAVWTLGTWHGSVANDLARYMPVLSGLVTEYPHNPTPPPDPPTPPPPPPPDAHQVVVVKLPQADDRALWTAVGAWSHDNGRRTQTASLHDMLNLLGAGNDQSFALVVNPEGQTAVTEALESAGHTWRPLHINSVPEPPTPPDPPDPPAPPPPSPPVLNHGDLVVDISNGNGPVDMAALMARGVKGFIIRATSGPMYNSTDEHGVDRRFWSYIEQATRLGAPVGCYMFLNEREPADVQVNRFYATLGQAVDGGANISLGVFYDAETYSPTAESVLHEAAILLVAGNFTDAPAGIYTGAWWWNRHVPATATWPRDLGLVCWAAYHLNAQGQPLASLPDPDRRFAVPNGWQRSDVVLWQFTSTGGLLVGRPSMNLDLNYWLDDGNVPVPPDPPTPPPAAVVDLSEYFQPSEPVGPWMVFKKVHDGVAVGGIDHQSHLVNGVILRLKGNPATAEYEEMRVSDGYLWRRFDTSPGDGRYYRLIDPGHDWSKWCPIHWAVGATYERRPLVTWFRKSDCGQISEQTETTYLHFAARHGRWRGGVDGQEFQDVIELHWRMTPHGGWVERYFLARGYGYVGWQSTNGMSHYCTELPQGRPPMQREVIPCIQ